MSSKSSRSPFLKVRPPAFLCPPNFVSRDEHSLNTSFKENLSLLFLAEPSQNSPSALSDKIIVGLLYSLQISPATTPFIPLGMLSPASTIVNFLYSSGELIPFRTSSVISC